MQVVRIDIIGLYRVKKPEYKQYFFYLILKYWNEIFLCVYFELPEIFIW
jgi:hypothetical protein